MSLTEGDMVVEEAQGSGMETMGREELEVSEGQAVTRLVPLEQAAGAVMKAVEEKLAVMQDLAALRGRKRVEEGEETVIPAGPEDTVEQEDLDMVEVVVEGVAPMEVLEGQAEEEGVLEAQTV